MRFLSVLWAAVLCLGLIPSDAIAQMKMPAVPAVEVTSDDIPPPVTYEKPERVTVGAHINDILEVDMRNHSYRLDMYVWFRWRDPSLRPWETAEFMNAFDPADHVRTPAYDVPQVMPDGSLHMVIRQQGKFSNKFPMHKFPFDRQLLVAAMEDSVDDVRGVVYITDRFEKGGPISANPEIVLPGLMMERPRLEIRAFPYPTGFGDLTQETLQPYARASFIMPVVRPAASTAVKIFLPLGLVIFCAGLVFFVHPSYVEGRLGVTITALLTLVALQLTTSSGLPEVDYLLMTDKIYALSYLFIIAAMLQVARTSPMVRAEKFTEAVRNDRRALVALLSLFVLGCGLVIGFSGG
jgi:hypothetical protein